MSNAFHLECVGCGEHDDGAYNNASENLINAVRSSYHVWALYKSDSEWDIWNLQYSYLSRIAGFIVRHWEHGGFAVVSEYYRKESFSEHLEDRCLVVPELPQGEYEALCLPWITQEAERIQKLLAETLHQAQRKHA